LRARPEAVRTPQEILLVDRRQQFQRRLLHDLVLQGGNGNRPLRPLLFRDVDPAERLRPVLPARQPIVELLKILPDVPAVLRVRDPIHARARVLPQPTPCALQRRHRQKMSDRGKL
jgi:hypothetical protein